MVNAFWADVGWLIVLIVTVAVPLALDAAGRLSYFTSLTLWAIPIAYLGPLFRSITHAGAARRRRALGWTIALIVVLGIVLDFLLGHLILRFEACANAPASLRCLPAVGGRVPFEEVLFYAMAPAAMVLAYACADERWLRQYNPPDDLLNVRLIQISPPLVVTAIVALSAVLVFWLVTGRVPAYALFLLAGALLPAMVLYRSVGSLVNWRAFALTALYTILTSIIWEVTLAIPRGWWGYQSSGMLGVTIAAWSAPPRIFPIEAAFVWLCAPFTSVLSYEFTKAFLEHPRPSRKALFG